MNFSAPAPQVTVSLEKEKTVTAAALPTPTATVAAAPKKTTTLLERLTGLVAAAAPAPAVTTATAHRTTVVATPPAPPPAPVPTAPTVILQSSPLGTLRTVSVPDAPAQIAVQVTGGPSEGKPRILPSATYAGPTEPFWATEGAGGAAPDTWSEYPAIANVDLATLDIENVGTIFFGPGLTDGLTQVADILEYKGDPVVTGTVVRNIVVGANQLQGDVTFTGSGQAAVTVTGSTVDISVPPPPPVVAVDSLNLLTGAVTLTSTTNTVTITPSGNTIDLEVQQTAVVDKLNGLTGEVVLSSSDGSITITPDTLTDKINISAVAVAPTAWANYPAISAVDLSSNALTDSNGVVAITADAALTLGKNQINLLAQNGAFGGSIGLTAKSGTLGTNGGLIELTADGGSEPTGLFGQINIVANPGTANVLDVPVTTGGSINIQANSGGSITTATSKVVLNAGGINIYSGVGTPFGSLFGYTYINASLGISLVAGAFTSGLQQPGTVYLYGETGITLGADTYAHNIYPILGSNLVLNGRITGEVVNINNAGTIAFNTGGALTGVATINGASYPPAAGGVTSLNTLTGAVDLVAGTDISITPVDNTLVISATGGAAPTEITNAGATVSCTSTGAISATTASTTPEENRISLTANGGISITSNNETLELVSQSSVTSKLTFDALGNQVLQAGDGGIISNFTTGQITLQAYNAGPGTLAASLDLKPDGVVNLSSVAGADVTIGTGDISALGTQILLSKNDLTVPYPGLYVGPSFLWFNGSKITPGIPSKITNVDQSSSVECTDAGPIVASAKATSTVTLTTADTTPPSVEVGNGIVSLNSSADSGSVVVGNGVVLLKSAASAANISVGLTDPGEVQLTPAVGSSLLLTNLPAASKPDIVYYDTSNRGAVSYGPLEIPIATEIANAGASVVCNTDTTVVIAQTTTSGGVTLDATGNLLLYGGSAGNPPSSNLDLQASGVINLTSSVGSDVTVKSGDVAAGGTQVVVASAGTAPAVGLYVSPSELKFNGTALPLTAGVTTLNSASGAVNIVAGTNIDISTVGQNITVTNTAPGSTLGKFGSTTGALALTGTYAAMATQTFTTTIAAAPLLVWGNLSLLNPTGGGSDAVVSARLLINGTAGLVQTITIPNGHTQTTSLLGGGTGPTPAGTFNVVVQALVSGGSATRVNCAIITNAQYTPSA